MHEFIILVIISFFIETAVFAESYTAPTAEQIYSINGKFFIKTNPK